MNSFKVLIIDDDLGIRRILEGAFKSEGASVYSAAHPDEGLRLIKELQPDLIILDIMLPEKNGYIVCAEVRTFSDVPIIMLTALDTEQQMVRGLDAGADDFVSKPFNHDVLLARARAVLRRRQLKPVPTHLSDFDDSYLRIDLQKHLVFVNNQRVRLTPTEQHLLEYMVSQANRLLSLDAILANVWGVNYQDSHEYVHVYISHLRQKIEPDPRKPRYLLTEYGNGYRFVNQPISS